MLPSGTGAVCHRSFHPHDGRLQDIVARARKPKRDGLDWSIFLDNAKDAQLHLSTSGKSTP